MSIKGQEEPVVPSTKSPQSKKGDPLWFVHEVWRIPCYKTSILYGLLTGSLLGLRAQYVYRGSARPLVKVADHTIIGGCIGALLSYYICQKKRKIDKERIAIVMAKNKVSSSPSSSSSTSSSTSPPSTPSVAS